MITFKDMFSLTEDNEEFAFRYKDAPILHEAVFVDLEHYIFRQPVCVGIFGAAYMIDRRLQTEQYFLESARDLKTLTLASLEFLMKKKAEGYKYLVTFAGKNDLMMIHAMFRKYGLTTDLRKEFICIDVQREFEKRFKIGIGLKPLEILSGINREGGDMSGASIAKTFARIMRDPEYIRRMDRQKIHRLIEYNKQDVVSLYHILAGWYELSDELIALYTSEKARLRAMEQSALENLTE